MKRSRKRGSVKVIGWKLKQLGYSNYREYLASEHWKELKRKFYSSKRVKRIEGKPICWSCNQAGLEMHVHHRSYTNLGNERLLDLALLCDQCHTKTHEVCKQRDSKKGLFNAHRVLKRRLKKTRDKEIERKLLTNI